MIAVRKNISNTIIVEKQTNLISQLYCICFDIKKIGEQTEKCLKKTRIINLYNNKIDWKQL